MIGIASVASPEVDGITNDIKAAGITAAVFVAALAYFWFYSRHHLVASAPEEEFAHLDEAESELE
jgi:ethanolamine permease